MKKMITDDRTSYIHYIRGTKEIYGTWHKINDPLASIEDVKNHHEIWNYPLIVTEGMFQYIDGEYQKVEKFRYDIYHQGANL